MSKKRSANEELALGIVIGVFIIGAIVLLWAVGQGLEALRLWMIGGAI